MRNAVAEVETEGDWLLNLTGLCLDGRFVIVRRLGPGSYAEIFLAKNTAPREGEPSEVVIKALNPRLQGDVEQDLERTLVENFTLEAQALLGFRHPNIARLFGCGTAADWGGRAFHYLVLEYMPGGSISQRCRGRALSYEQALLYTRQICEALTCAHYHGPHGVLHRDVKPSNVMLSADGTTVKLLDFGTARRMDSAGSVTKVGTDVYAAPEHFSLAGQPQCAVTPAADVYGMAKTFYYMVCGEPPSRFSQRPISSLPGRLADQPWARGVLQVLRRATSNSPAARNQSAREFYEDLAAAAEVTVYAARQDDVEPQVGLHGQSRIVVEVTPEGRRDYRGDLSRLCAEVTRRVAKSAGVIAALCRAGWLWARPALRRGAVALASSCRDGRQRVKPLRGDLVSRVTAVALAAIILLAGTPHFLKWWRLKIADGAQEEQGPAGQQSGVPATATTDVNLRSGPGVKFPKVGLVERDSAVRILSYSDDRKWCEVEVTRHGRQKEDRSSADRGWVKGNYFKPAP